MNKNKLKELRENHKETQEFIGNLVNVTKSTISKYENNDLDIPNQSLKIFARHFNVTTDYLLGISNEPSTLNEIDKKIQENNLHIAANSNVDLGKLAKLDKKQTKIINSLIDDFLNDEED